MLTVTVQMNTMQIATSLFQFNRSITRSHSLFLVILTCRSNALRHSFFDNSTFGAIPYNKTLDTGLPVRFKELEGGS